MSAKLIATLAASSRQIAFGFEKGWAATLPSRATLRFSEGQWILHLDNAAKYVIGNYDIGGNYAWCRLTSKDMRPSFQFRHYPIQFQELPGSNLLLLDPLPWTHVDAPAKRGAEGQAPAPTHSPSQSFLVETLREAISLVNLSLPDLPGATLHIRPDGTLGATLTVDL